MFNRFYSAAVGQTSLREFPFMATTEAPFIFFFFNCCCILMLLLLNAEMWCYLKRTKVERGQRKWFNCTLSQIIRSHCVFTTPTNKFSDSCIPCSNRDNDSASSSALWFLFFFQTSPRDQKITPVISFWFFQSAHNIKINSGLNWCDFNGAKSIRSQRAKRKKEGSERRLNTSKQALPPWG